MLSRDEFEEVFEGQFERPRLAYPFALGWTYGVCIAGYAALAALAGHALGLI